MNMWPNLSIWDVTKICWEDSRKDYFTFKTHKEETTLLSPSNVIRSGCDAWNRCNHFAPNLKMMSSNTGGQRHNNHRGELQLDMLRLEGAILPLEDNRLPYCLSQWAGQKHPKYWPPSALTRELHRAKLLRKHFVGLAHNLNHKLMKIRIFSIVNNDLPPIIIQGHSPLPQNVNTNERK